MANVRANDLKRAAALEALQTESTFTAAASKAGISRRTLYDYLYNDKEFAFEYRNQLRLRSITRAEQATTERETALQTIREIMQDDAQPAAVRLKAAERLLDYADKGCVAEYRCAGDAVDKHTGWAFE